MRIVHYLRIALFVGAGLSLNPSAAIAGCGVVPTFTATLEPSSAPAPPAEPYSLAGLDLYRAKLEIFRENSMEAYNRKLISYGETLNRLDQSFLRALAKGNCTAADYESVKDQIIEELRKIGSDYLEPYRQANTSYKQYSEWCKREIARIRFATGSLHRLDQASASLRPAYPNKHF